MNLKPNRLRLASIAFIGLAILLATTPLLAGSQYGSNASPVVIAGNDTGWSDSSAIAVDDAGPVTVYGRVEYSNRTYGNSGYTGYQNRAARYISVDVLDAYGYWLQTTATDASGSRCPPAMVVRPVMSDNLRLDKVANSGESRCSTTFGCGHRREAVTFSNTGFRIPAGPA